MRKLILLCLLALPSFAAIPVLVQKKSCTSAGAVVLTQTCTYNTNPTAGNFLWASGTTYNTTVTFSGGGTWVADNNGNLTPNHSALFIAHVDSATGGATTVTQSNALSSYAILHIYEFSGMAASSTLDQNPAANIFNTSQPSITTLATGTTTVANELIMVAAANDITSIYTAGTGFTLGQGDFNASTTVVTEGDEYQIVSATGSYTGTFSVSASLSNGYVAIIATYKGAAGAAPALVIHKPIFQ